MYIRKNGTTTNQSQHGGKTMDIKTYAGILKFAIMTQIDYVKENHWEEDDYYNGVIEGLEIALEKIDASMFLAEK